MKRTRFARETCFSAFVFKSASEMQTGCLRTQVDSDPEHAWLTAWRKRTTALDDDFKGFDFGCSDRSRGRESLNARDRKVPDEFQSEVQVIFSTPTRANFGDGFAQTVDVIGHLPPQSGWHFNSDENAPPVAGSADILSADRLTLHRNLCSERRHPVCFFLLALMLPVLGCRQDVCAPGLSNS